MNSIYIPIATPAPVSAGTADNSQSVTIIFGILATLLAIAALAVAVIQILHLRHVDAASDVSILGSDIDVGLGHVNEPQDNPDASAGEQSASSRQTGE